MYLQLGHGHDWKVDPIPLVPPPCTSPTEVRYLHLVGVKKNVRSPRTHHLARNRNSDLFISCLGHPIPRRVVKYNRNNEPPFTGVGTPKAVFEKCDGFFNTRECATGSNRNIIVQTGESFPGRPTGARGHPNRPQLETLDKTAEKSRLPVFKHQLQRRDLSEEKPTAPIACYGDHRPPCICLKTSVMTHMTQPRCPRETQTGREKPAIGKPPTLVFINIARARGRANYTPVNRATAHGKHGWQRCCPATWTPGFARQTPGQAALLSRHLDSGAVKSTGNGCLLYWGSWTVVKGYDSLSRRHTVDDIRPNVFITVPKGRRNFRIVRESMAFFA
ncbi:hypothetical protein Bbelb_408320 [Branchiostoma belcheri]|nr:hypothetical protein Bbelb_408320 [Branchiostoma belcheri]